MDRKLINYRDSLGHVRNWTCKHSGCGCLTMQTLKTFAQEKGRESFSRAFTTIQLLRLTGLGEQLMHKSQPQRLNGNNETLPPSSKLDRIDELLQEQLEYFPAKELTAAEISRWHSDLKGYSVAAIEWAFECHRRSGRFFPLPADIFAFLADWEPTPEWFDDDLPKGRQPLCDNWPVILALGVMVCDRVKEFKDRKEPYVRLTAKEGQELYAKAKARVDHSIQKGLARNRATSAGSSEGNDADPLATDG